MFSARFPSSQTLCPFFLPVLCCLLSSPPPEPTINSWHHPLIKPRVVATLCASLSDAAPAVRFLGVSAVQNLITIAGLAIDDVPQLLPPLCMNRFHHADGVKTVAHVGSNSAHTCARTHSHSHSHLRARALTWSTTHTHMRARVLRTDDARTDDLMCTRTGRGRRWGTQEGALGAPASTHASVLPPASARWLCRVGRARRRRRRAHRPHAPPSSRWCAPTQNTQGACLAAHGGLQE